VKRAIRSIRAYGQALTARAAPRAEIAAKNDRACAHEDQPALRSGQTMAHLNRAKPECEGP